VRKARNQLPRAPPADRDASSVDKLDLQSLAHAPRRAHTIEIHDGRAMDAREACAA